MVYFQALFAAGPSQHSADRRVLNLRYLTHVLNLRVNNAMFVLKKRRQMAATDVTILVDGRGQHRAAVLLIPSRVVGAAAEKRDAKWGAGDDHDELMQARLS